MGGTGLSLAGTRPAPAGDQQMDITASFPWAPTFLSPDSCPDVDAARPPSCPWCGRVAFDGEQRWLWGHGPRHREVVVLPLPETTERVVATWTRRYRCQACRRSCTVRPPGLLARFLYSLWAIALAWLLVEPPPFGAGVSEKRAYQRQGMWVHSAWTAATRYRWRSLERWRGVLPERCFGLGLGVTALLTTATMRARDGTLRAIAAAAAELLGGGRI